MASNKPIPAEIRLITSTRDKHGKLTRERLTKNRLKVEPGIPEPPMELRPLALEEWNRISVPLYNLGVLTKYDRAILALYCQAWGLWREASAKVNEDGFTIVRGSNVVQNPALVIANEAARNVARYGAELGLTPSARSRIATTGLNAAAAQQAETDDFSEFVA